MPNPQPTVITPRSSANVGCAARRVRPAWFTGALVCLLLAACKPAALPGSGHKPDAAAAARALPLADEARKLLLQGDAAGALQQLQSALKADRNLPAVHQLLGQVQLQLGDVVAAVAAYTDALRLGADRNEVVLPLAAALVAQGQPQALLDQSRLDDAGLVPHVRMPLLLMKAEAAAMLGQAPAAQRHIEAARAINPQQPAPWLAEARTRLLAGQPEAAKLAADKALALAPASSVALATRADVALALGDRAAALALYERSLAAPGASSVDASMAAPGASTSTQDARVARAGLLMEAPRSSAADTALAAAIGQLAPTQATDPRVAYLMALLADRQGRSAEAKTGMAAVAQVLQRVPPEALNHRPQLLMLGGLAHLSLAETDKARVHLEAAQRSAAAAGPATRLIAQSHLADNNLERAITVLEAHLKLRTPGLASGQNAVTKPDQPAAQGVDHHAVLMLVGAQLALGRHTRAINLLQDTLARQDNATMRGLLAAGHASTGGWLAAQNELMQALKSAPQHTGLQAALCTLQLFSGQPAKAVQSAQVLVQRAPEHPGWQHLLGVALVRHGQVAAARTAFEAAVRSDAAFAAPRVALARLHAQAGGLDAAQAQLQAVLQLEPQHADALFEMGRLALQRQQFAAAQGWFEKAQAAAASGDHQATLALVDLHLSQRKLPAATAALRSLALRQPDDLLVLLAQARLAMASQDTVTAKNLLTRATGLAGYEAGALVQVAVLQLLATPAPAAAATVALAPASAPGSAPATSASPLNTSAGAQYALEKALADNPGLLAAQALMVDVELRQRETERAQARVQQLVAAHPRLALVHALQGDVALARGQTTAALAAYRRAQQLEPASAHVLRIHRTLAASDPAGANAAASQWLEQHPTDHAVRRVLADGQARLAQYAAARSSYQLIAEATPGDGETLNNLAHVMLLLKDPAALATAERALEAKPEAAHIMATAGFANMLAGKTERGMNWLRDARQREPGNGDTRYFMAAALAQLGRTPEARAEARSALALGTPFVHAADTQRLLDTLR